MTTQAPVSPLETTLEVFKTEMLMAVLRCDSAEEAIWAGRLAAQNGIRLLDVTFGTPETERVIETLAQEFPDVVVGAGTVLKPADGLKALGAGARFLASPVMNPEMIQFGVENNVLVLPGVSTPTEMVNALTAGAQILKIFPAGSLGGAEFIKTISGPLPNMPMIATGGIDEDDLCDYWAAGVWTVGLGTKLIPAKALAERNEEKIVKRIKKLLAIRDAYLNPESCEGADEAWEDKPEKKEKSEKNKDQDYKEKKFKEKDHKKDKHDKHHEKSESEDVDSQMEAE